MTILRLHDGETLPDAFERVTRERDILRLNVKEEQDEAIACEKRASLAERERDAARARLVALSIDGMTETTLDLKAENARLRALLKSLGWSESEEGTVGGLGAALLKAERERDEARAELASYKGMYATALIRQSERDDALARAHNAERERDEARAHCRNHHLEPCESCACVESEVTALREENARLRALLVDLHEWLSCLSEYEYERMPANGMTLETALARLDAALGDSKGDPQ